VSPARLLNGRFDGRTGVAIDQSEYRRVMGHFATGVTVVTTRDHDGRPFGLTANAVASVSLQPPMVLVCVDRQSESHDAFAASRVFAVNILTQMQETLSRRFAKSSTDKFAGIGSREGVSGAPILEGVLAYLECRLLHAFEAGDHTIFVGEVVDLATGAEEEPLLFFRGGYRSTAT